MLSTQTGTQGDLPPAQPSDEKAEVKVTSVDDKSPSQTLPSQTHPQEPLLSFAADFWDKPELVVKGYMSRIATLDGFVRLFHSSNLLLAVYLTRLLLFFSTTIGPILMSIAVFSFPLPSRLTILHRVRLLRLIMGMP